MTTNPPTTAAGRALLSDVETYRVFSTSGRAEGVNMLDPWEAIRRRLEGPEGILAIEAEARQPDSESLRLALQEVVDQWDDYGPASKHGVPAAIEHARKVLAALSPSDPPAA